MRLSMLAEIVCVLAMAMAEGCQGQNSKQDYLEAHNAARAEVGVGPLEWDDTVVAYAESFASRRVGDCRMAHSGGPYGENIMVGTFHITGSQAVEAWASEKQYYDYNSNSCTAGDICGHYTQVVWNTTIRLGCARVHCTNSWWFVICNYDPPGNYVGQRPYVKRPNPHFYLQCDL